ncbi:MAG TPA: hypothetical protein VIP51_06885 [Eoetvoesiella sp.]
MPSNPEPDLIFTPDELDLLGRTADALSAYMGKPVLAEVIDAEETGFEWVLFAVPLGTDEVTDDVVVVQVGGNGARIIGNQGGLSIDDGDIYDCEYLWAVQLSDLEGVRYIKIDQQGEEIAWSDELRNILPFALTDEPIPDDDDDDEDNDDEDNQDPDDDIDPPVISPSRTLH